MKRQQRPMPRSVTRAVARHGPRPGSGSPAGLALPAAAALLVILALLPAGWLGWAGWFGDLTGTLITPISHPVASAAGLLRPTRSRVEERNAEVLYEELQREQTARLQAEERADRLAQQLAELSRGGAVNPDVEVRQTPASAAGNTNGMLVVRAARSRGIAVGAVATAAGVQLVGTVEDVNHATGLCRILPITNRAVRPLTALVMLDDAASDSRACLLTPQGDGTLRGDLEAAGPDAQGTAVAIGQTVRLRDEAWPEHAQMLVLGRIERIEPRPEAPLRSVITVRPTVDPLQAAEVVIRSPITAGGAG